MPTAYTAIIGERDSVSFKEFALRCAHGACIQMRDVSLDAPIPDRFEPDTRYYNEREQEAVRQIAILEAMSQDDAARAAEEEYEDALARVITANEQAATLRVKYEKMIADVRAWAPPTPDHEGLKAFMLEQLERSMGFGCHIIATPKRVSTERWRQANLDHVRADLNLARERIADEIRWTESRNKWLAALRSSLEEQG
jgi:hypothetical protein